MPSSEQNETRGILNQTNVTLLLAGVISICAAAVVVRATPHSFVLPENLASSVPSLVVSSSHAAGAPATVWATSAPGRIEPKGGSVEVRAEASGRVLNVYSSPGEKVRQHEVLARLRDDEAWTRLVQARAEVAVRLGERDEEEEKDKLAVERRAAADAVAKAERAVHQAWLALDRTFLKQRVGDAKKEDVDAAIERLNAAKAEVEKKAEELEEVRAKEGMPLPTRLDSGLTLARGDLRLAEIAYENTRLRAPIDGTVLEFRAKVGEMMSATAQRPAAVIGDMSTIQVTAEVQERDVSKVSMGQMVVVRSNAFDGSEFLGKVTEIAPSVGLPGLRAQGPRQQFDAEVLEVKIELDGNPPVMPGMRVDVFFKPVQKATAAKE